jgi:CBS domain-containing protein
VARRPPIGFFREFVLESEGDHTDTLDLKRGGVGAVVELARVYALTLGMPEINTRARLEQTAAAKKLGSAQVDDLLDAFEFISYVRLRHQGRQVRDGEVPDNFVSPDELTNVERRHLRDVFQVVRKAQSVLAQTYPLQYVS